ncbi:amidohydrolase [Microbacterium sp. CFH 31415]|uniref:amidohydrolase family protein n=1 Tax=Microbacterium sp. CFH 31415 TaxID=2921732 RepID=UPI001F12C9B1|nr:amidohydrolase family protein [Microbacterium sp. CFH 31415]MCH6231637.1 amidohydrolase [Microbacterium sp. CFH 31415]
MSDLRIIDMHAHVQRSDAHGHEIRDYFLGPALVKPGAPNLGTVDEVREMMAATGISEVNMLQFTWSGRYLRHGRYTLPDDPADAAAGEEELRRRAARRASDNNAWAASVHAEDARFTFFAGVNPVVMGAEGAAEEARRRVAQGALGIKIVPSDMGISGDDTLLFPLYEYCVEAGVPVLTETGGHSPHCQPAPFGAALGAFPGLRIVFAHCGHDRELGGALDQEVLELAARHEGVYGDTSLRLHEVADGTVSADDMVRFLRRIGFDRLMFGSNYIFCDVLPTRPGHVAAPDHVDPRFTQVWKSVQVLRTLPVGDDERERLASGTFLELTRS